MQILKNLFKYAQILITGKWIFFKPKKKEILIYDKNGSKYLLDFLDESKCFVYDCRGESINFYVLFSSILNFGFKNLKENYKKYYINYINPKFIITYVDNNPAFYLLKNIKKDAKVIFTQFCYRNQKELNLFDENGKKNKNYHVDYMLTFGDVLGEQYSKMIEGKCISIGNIRNNNFHFKEEIEKNSLVFISQFKAGRIFPKNEIILLRILKKYCLEKKLKLYVCTKVVRSDQRGIRMFTKFLGKEGWYYSPRDHSESSYERVFKSEFVVFADSTLGYEALSRGKKTAALSFGSRDIEWCKKNTAHQIIPFGYPLNFSDTGPFWSNIYRKKQIVYILDYITSVSDREWSETLKKYHMDKIITFDQDNKKLLSLFIDLKIPLKKNV